MVGTSNSGFFFTETSVHSICWKLRCCLFFILHHLLYLSYDIEICIVSRNMCIVTPLIKAKIASCKKNSRKDVIFSIYFFFKCNYITDSFKYREQTFIYKKRKSSFTHNIRVKNALSNNPAALWLWRWNYVNNFTPSNNIMCLGNASKTNSHHWLSWIN